MKITDLLKTSGLGAPELILRAFVGCTMIYHGQGKLFALERTAALFTKLGIEPANIMAVLAGLGETLGGLALVLGLLTRLGAVSTAICMAVAMVYLGLPNGFNIVNGGYEYQLTLILVFLFFLIKGAGKYSLDNLISSKFLANR